MPQIVLTTKLRRREVRVLMTTAELATCSPGCSVTCAGGTLVLSEKNVADMPGAQYARVSVGHVSVLLPADQLARLKDPVRPGAGRTRLEAIGFELDHLCSCGRAYVPGEPFCPRCGTKHAAVRDEHPIPYADDIRFEIVDFEPPAPAAVAEEDDEGGAGG